MIAKPNLEIDYSKHMPAVGSNVLEKWNEFNFYYIKEYPIKKLLSLISFDLNGLSTREISVKFYNLDYQMLSYLHMDWIQMFSKVWFYLVTSFDKYGIKVPLNYYYPEYMHPGGKRVCVGSYLGMDTVPVLLQARTVLKKDVYDFKICKPEELSKIYPDNNFTIFCLKGSPAIEVHYLESRIKSTSNIDGWMERGNKIVDESEYAPIYKNFVDTGINVVSDSTREFEHEIKCDQGRSYKTIFTKKPISDVYIKLNDLSKKNYDFWKLIWYFDPRYKNKSSLKKEIEICNTRHTAVETMRSRYMLKTLTEPKNRVPSSNHAEFISWEQTK